MSEPTKGPWVAVDLDICTPDRMRVIARVDQYTFACGDNARLIAAAPELLEACLWLTNIACGVGRAGDDPEVGEHEAAIEAGKAAIAKAEGR